jgi:hypothetical protein
VWLWLEDCARNGGLARGLINNVFVLVGMKLNYTALSFFRVFGRVYSVIVNEYLLEMLNDSVPNIFTDELILLLLSHHFSVRPLTSLRERVCVREGRTGKG